jgi:uncharacterized protein YjiS (DUF1127 family)
MPAITALSMAVSFQLGRVLTVFGRRLVRRLLQMKRAVEYRREMQVLARFDDRMLADIGLNRADVQDAYSSSILSGPTIVLRSRALERRLARHGITHGLATGLAATKAVAPPLAPQLDVRAVSQARNAFSRCA